MNILFANIQTCLLNIFLVYFCFSVYFKFLERKTNNLTNSLIIVLVCGISIIFCMSFPITILDGNLVDFRQVPLIVGALYGGRRVALILTGVLLGYRFYLGLPNFDVASLIYALLIILLCLIIPFFKNTVNLRKKLSMGMVASGFGALSTLALILLFSPLAITIEHVVFLLIVLTFQTIGILFIVSFNEKSRKDVVLSREIAKLEKLKTVSTIAASISHEVRNPLTVTKGFLQLLREPHISDQDKERYIKTALEALEKAESTITDYLTFAKPSLENVKVLNLHKELTSIKNFVGPYATMNDVEIETSLEEHIYIAGEKEKLHQCLINIAKNGIEAMPQGGTLKIELKRFGGNAIITFTDTGIGMNEEQLDRLGNPFFTTKDIGTGLGTMVVYSIVKAMRGEIYVDSKPDKGTSFTIFLPLADGSDTSI